MCGLAPQLRRKSLAVGMDFSFDRTEKRWVAEVVDMAAEGRVAASAEVEKIDTPENAYMMLTFGCK